MKLLKLSAQLLGLMLLFAACGSKSTIDKAKGYWLLKQDGTNLGVTINSDGTGEVTFSAKNSMGRNELLMREDVTITSEGNDIYVTFDNGSSGHFYYEDGVLYSDDGNPFRKVN